MSKILTIIQVITAILLIASVLLQNQGSGLSSAIGGGTGKSFHTKRGAEKFLYISTIIIAIIFFGVAVAKLFVA